jgi:hypothetical protein
MNHARQPSGSSRVFDGIAKQMPGAIEVPRAQAKHEDLKPLGTKTVRATILDLDKQRQLGQSPRRVLSKQIAKMHK